MDVINSYKSYKKYLPEYAQWRDKQDLERERRLEYLNKNPDKMNSEDIERGKILLRAIDVMDEYSQSNAEDMEVATDFAIGQVVGLASMAGTFGGFALGQVKGVQKFISKFVKDPLKWQLVLNIIPSLVGTTIGTLAAFPAIIWATKAKVSASRKGRFEAMNKDLQNPALFAVLTPEQQKKVDERAKDIELEDREKKRLEQRKHFSLNPAESFRTLKKCYKGDSTYKEQKAAFDKKFQENKENFNQKLSEEQIRNAKRDQQILAEMVRRLDVASQDYAENTELATNTVTTLALGTGGLVGWISNKIISGLKIKGGGAVKAIPYVIGAAIPLAIGIYVAKLQKQASRIGRFKAKQEMLNNPAELVYVDSKDTAASNIKYVERKKKPNMFMFLKQLIKDNKEYTQYLKNEGELELKRHKAVEKLKLTDEQIHRAKVLQNNVFKTFNTVDEKSQTYSESVEAMGESIKQGVAFIGSTVATVFSLRNIYKTLDNIATQESAKKQNSVIKAVSKTLTPFIWAVLPIIAVDIYTTKAQKKASRVADMLALKELGDYRHYADYAREQKLPQVQNSTNMLEKFKNVK